MLTDEEVNMNSCWVTSNDSHHLLSVTVPEKAKKSTGVVRINMVFSRHFKGKVMRGGLLV